MLFVIFSNILIKCVLFAEMAQVFSLNKTLKKTTGKWKKYWEVREMLGNFVSLEKWEPWLKGKFLKERDV